jgi:ADP-dependent NAD(P)H-hydrate dehydratase
MEELIEKLGRPSDSHKGENGKVLVIGGSRKYAGAPALASEAALRAGADLVKILTAEEARPVVQGFSENLIVESYGEDLDENSLEKAWELEEWADATVIGPGLTDFDEIALKEFGEKAENLVVDAEVIEPLMETSGNVFTPHSGEAEVLKNGYGSIQAFARETGNKALLKGEIDKVFSGEDVCSSETGNAGMTVGGSGDVLTGLVAAFEAQGLKDVEAATLAAHVNGEAGDRAYEEYGNGLVATDIVEKIPEVLKNY